MDCLLWRISVSTTGLAVPRVMLSTNLATSVEMWTEALPCSTNERCEIAFNALR